MAICVWTDGSSLGNPGPGGWGAILQMKSDEVRGTPHPSPLPKGEGVREVVLSGGVEGTTNNRMELTAVIEALLFLQKKYKDEGIVASYEEMKSGVFQMKADDGIGLFATAVHDDEKIEDTIVIYTDSTYVQKGVTEWLPTRVRRNWRRAKGGKLIENVDLRQQMHALLPYFTSLDWQWVKGHAGDEMNERVDDIARGEAERILNRRS